MPERKTDEEDKKIADLKELLKSLQYGYKLTRWDQTKNQVWFSKNAILASVGSFCSVICSMLVLQIVSLQSAETSLIAISSHFTIGYILSIASTIGLFPLIMSASINFVKINKINSELSDLYSEIRITQNQILTLELERSSKSHQNQSEDSKSSN